MLTIEIELCAYTKLRQPHDLVEKIRKEINFMTSS